MTQACGLVVERRPGDQQVEARAEPGLDRPGLERRVEPEAGHERRRGVRAKYAWPTTFSGPSENSDRQARDDRVVRGLVEGRVVAAEADHEVALVLAGEPGVEREAAGQLARSRRAGTTPATACPSTASSPVDGVNDATTSIST